MKLFIVLLAIAGVSACTAGPQSSGADASEAWSGAHCITDGRRLQRMTPAQIQASDWAEHVPPQASQSLLIVRAGSRPTAGYGLRLAEQSRQNGKLQLVIEERQPAPDSMRAQVMTSPCIALWVPAAMELDVRWSKASIPSESADQKRPY